MKFAALAALACAASSQAAIIGVAGNVVQIAPPPSVNPGILPTPVNAVAFNEQQNRTAAGNGDITINPWVAPPLSPGGWAGFVNSHLIHADSGAAGVMLNCSVLFDGPIIAVALSSPGNIPPNFLDTTDFLGALGTAYPTGFPTRGWNGAGTIQVVANQIRFTQVFVTGLDQFRVITQAPAPGSLALLGLAGLITGRRRR